MYKIVGFCQNLKFPKFSSAEQADDPIRENNEKLLKPSTEVLCEKDVNKYCDKVKVNMHNAVLDLTSKPVYNDQVLNGILQKHESPQKVTKIVLKKNYAIQRIPVSIALLGNLQVLDLKDNAISDIPWSIVYLKQLKIMDLSYNLIETIPQCIGYLTQLETLYLEVNRISALPTELLRLVNLKDIKLAGNRIPMKYSDKDDIFAMLRDRDNRKNDWNDFTRYYKGDCSGYFAYFVKSLQELCIDTVLKNNVTFLHLTTLPPIIKCELDSLSMERRKEINPAKCSRCGGYFSSRENFDTHLCSSTK